MPTFKLTLAYDGTGFVGWQRQASGVSIQGLLEDALRGLADRDVPVTGAGRTDAGVHALGQVASVSIERTMGAGALMRALNGRLPGAVRVVAAEEAAPAFHARFDAGAKTYRYRIWNAGVITPFEGRYAWHVVAPLDVDRMAAAGRLLEGRHDFSAFQAAGASTATTERAITASRIVTTRLSTTGNKFPTTEDAEDTDERIVLSSGMDVRFLRGGELTSPLIVYEITGDGFLRHMVRNIVGTLVEIGRGRRPVDWIGQVLRSRDRKVAGPTAPPEGLFLVAVDYPINGCDLPRQA